ncbi:MAG: hypothetical protein RLZZ628_3853, partial [Bacteroidota bacterium]
RKAQIILKGKATLCNTLEFGLNKIFLGLNRIDFLGFLGFLIEIQILKILKNQSYLIPKKSDLIQIPAYLTNEFIII